MQQVWGFERGLVRDDSAPPVPGVRIGLALGGGFARGIAHAGVLRIFEEQRTPIHCVTGVSAGSIVAAAYASGTASEEIARAGCSMRFSDAGRWSLCRLGLVGSERMSQFLKRLLKAYRFEEMRTPLGVVATDLSTGRPVSCSKACKSGAKLLRSSLDATRRRSSTSMSGSRVTSVRSDGLALIVLKIQGGGNMPAYGKNLNPAETTALVAFLESLHPSGEAPASDASRTAGDHP